MSAVLTDFAHIEARVLAYLEPSVVLAVAFYDAMREHATDRTARALAERYLRRKVPDLSPHGAECALVEALEVRRSSVSARLRADLEALASDEVPDGEYES